MAENKMDKIVAMIAEGTHTRQEVLEQAGCTPKSLASYLASMRTAAKISGQPICPVEETQEDGTKIMKLVSYSEYEAQREEAKSRSKASKALTPEERFDRAAKRLTRCETMAERAQERAESDPDNRELDLRAQKAKIELELAQIEYDRAKADWDAESSAEDEPVDEDFDVDEEEELM